MAPSTYTNLPAPASRWKGHWSQMIHESNRNCTEIDQQPRPLPRVISWHTAAYTQQRCIIQNKFRGLQTKSFSWQCEWNVLAEDMQDFKYNAFQLRTIPFAIPIVGKQYLTTCTAQLFTKFTNFIATFWWCYGRLHQARKDDHSIIEMLQ